MENSFTKLTLPLSAEARQTMLEHSLELHPHALYWLNEDGTIVYANKAGCQVLGYTHDELIGMNVADVNPAATHEAMQAVWETVRRDGRFQKVSVHRRKDGSGFPVEITSVLIHVGNSAYIAGYARDISELKRAEIELRRNEEIFRAAFMGNPGACALSSLIDGGVVREVNHGFTSLFGFTREECIGRTSLDLGIWVQPQERAKVLERVRTSGHMDWQEFRGRRRDGQMFTALLSATLLTIDRQPYLYWTIQDLTDQKRAAAAPAESEERYRVLFESWQDAILIVGDDNCILDCNSRAVDLFGYSRQELLHLRPCDLLPAAQSDAAYLAGLATPLMHTTRSGKSPFFEWKHRRANGEVFDAEISLQRATFGGKTRVIATVRDITERKRAEQALRESEEWFRTVIQTGPDAILISRQSDNTLEFVNSRFTDFTGFTLEEAFGKTAVELGVWDIGDRQRLLQALQTQQTVHGFEAWATRKDGTRFMIQLSARLQTIQGTLHLLVFAREVTAQRLADAVLATPQNELRQLTQHIEQVREEERKWIALEIHDELGQFLTALRMDVAWLKKRMPPATNPLALKVGDMDGLLLAAMDSVKRIAQRLRPVPLEEMGLVNAIEWLVDEFATRTGILCRRDVRLASCELGLEVGTAVFRILQEALNNTARHAQATCVDISIAVAGNSLVLRVADNGIGFDPSVVDATRSFGLIGARERARFLRGNIEVTSITGGGTTLVATIPLGGPGEQHDTDSHWR